MFQFARFPLLTYVFSQQHQGIDPRWVSPFRHPRILRLYTAPRGFSQCTTSFFGILCQGILRAPLIACLLDMENQTLSSNSSLLRVLAVYSSVKVLEQLLNHPWPTTISSPENIVVAH